MPEEIENLQPQQFIPLIQDRLSELKELLKLKEKAFKRAPAGSVRINHNKGTLQFYKRENPADLQGKYLDRTQKN